MRKKKIIDPKDVIIDPVDAIKTTDEKGTPLLDDPNFLGTKPIELRRGKSIAKVNMMLPPGISSFYVERVDKTHIRFLIRTSEITRLAEKAEKMMEANPDKKVVN